MKHYGNTYKSFFPYSFTMVKYKCPKCGFESNEPGEHCGVAMEEAKEEAQEEIIEEPETTESKEKTTEQPEEPEKPEQ